MFHVKGGQRDTTTKGNTDPGMNPALEGKNATKDIVMSTGEAGIPMLDWVKDCINV